jgi:hypothetical protein
MARPDYTWCDDHNCFHPTLLWLASSPSPDHTRVFPMEQIHLLELAEIGILPASASWLKLWYAERQRVRACQDYDSSV